MGARIVQLCLFAGPFMMLAFLSSCTTAIEHEEPGANGKKSDEAGEKTADTEQGESKPGAEKAEGDSAGASSSDKSSSSDKEQPTTTGAGDDGEKTSSTPDENTSSSEKQPDSSQEDTKEVPLPDCKAGETRACDQRVDGTKIDFPGGVPQGSCKLGEQACKEGKWGICEGAIEPKPRDTCEEGNDDNCNGKATDHCKCNQGETESCGSNVGECRAGTRTCDSNGNWGECKGEVKPSKEICGGGKDEDCNGLADMDDPKCNCLNGQSRECQVGTRRGDCGLGYQRCVDGDFVSSCTPRFVATQEVCGTQRDKFGQATGDEDCDGQVDETDSRNPSPRGCTLYFEDKDGDGFGAMGGDLAQGRGGATYGCLCESAGVPSFWKRGPRGRENSDCGDCVNQGDLVRPNNTGYYDKPSACLQELGNRKAFDYNCDGKESPKHVGSIECTRSPLGECVQTAGFWSNDGGTPACGIKGLKGKCRPEPREKNGVEVCLYASLIDPVMQSCN